MAEVQIEVSLKKNRDVAGTMIVWVDHGIVATFPVLARGNRGVGDTQMIEEGNTPTGEYDGREFVETKYWNQRSYGPHGAVRLRPVSGNALKARSLGRQGLLIHGGAPGGPNDLPSRGALSLTKGCLRLSNTNMLSLRKTLAAVRPAAVAGRAVTVADVLHTVRVTVSEY